MYSLTKAMYRNEAFEKNDETKMPIIINAVSLKNTESPSAFRSYQSRRGSMIYFPVERCHCSECMNIPYYTRVYSPGNTSYSSIEMSPEVKRSDSPDSKMSVASIEYNSSVDGSTESFACIHCAARFITKSELEQHISTHRNQKEYICHKCDRSFTWFGNFQKHMLSHGDIESQKHPFFGYPIACEEDLLLRKGDGFQCGLCLDQRTCDLSSKCCWDGGVCKQGVCGNALSA